MKWTFQLLAVSLPLVLALSGCATYKTHYGVFSAANSAGQDRQFRVIWMTADYPDWWFVQDQSTPLRLETQCSTRIWKLRDANLDKEPHDCGKGVRACGVSGQDLRVATGESANSHTSCIQVANANRILELDRQVELVVSCRPREVSIKNNGEIENRDYLRPSVVPYRVRVKEVPRSSLSARPPELDDDVCGGS